MIKPNAKEKQNLQRTIRNRTYAIIIRMMNEDLPEQEIVTALQCDGDLNALQGNLASVCGLTAPTYNGE